MPKFQYTVKDENGKDITGIQEAADMKDLVSAFRTKGCIIVKIREKKESTLFSKGGSKKITIDDLVVFTRQLATLIDAGVPLVQGLDILADQLGETGLGVKITEIKSEVESGSTFSEAIDKHKKAFSNLYVNMIRAGEMSGQLQDILDRLATYLEKTSNLQKKVKSALIYPAVVTSVAILITIFMMTFVIPAFAKIFVGLGAPLPVPTMMLITASHFLKNNLLYGVGLIFVIVFLFKRFIATKKGRRAWDYFQLKVPMFGPLIVKVVMGKFSRTLSTLVKSGVPILGAFEIVQNTVGNVVVESVLAEVSENIKEGGDITSVLQKHSVFPTMVTRMLSVGEKSGEMDTMLAKIADFYDEQVDIAVEGLTSIIEPLIIVFLGVVIGGMVIAMFLPIFNLTATM